MPALAALPLTPRILALTGLAMLSFAGNSLLTRAALHYTLIDAASFGSLRLVSGAAVLWLLLRLRTGQATASRRDPWAAAMLFVYVAGFSFAYRWLDAGTGALILFGSVQVTMFAAGLRAGESFPPLACVGALAAIAGLGVLLWPGASAPAPAGAALMVAAGLAWGVYSLRGRGVADALAATASNFLWATPLALALSVVTLAQAQWQGSGALLALASGALTSALGYVIWYAAVPALGALRAAVVQLSVPAIAALGGMAWLGEQLSLRLLGASAAILGGIGLVLAARVRSARR